MSTSQPRVIKPEEYDRVVDHNRIMKQTCKEALEMIEEGEAAFKGAISLVNETQRMIGSFTNGDSEISKILRNVWNKNAEFLSNHASWQTSYLKEKGQL